MSIRTGESGISHQTDDALELYALGRLPEPQVAVVEEHLLICGACQERLDEVEAFALAMRAGIAAEPAPEPRTAWFGWLRQPVAAWAGGFAIAVLAVGLYASLGRSHVAPLASLQLTAMRGEVQSAAPAKETDITLTDAPAEDAGALRVAVVDAAGGTVWSGAPGLRTVRITKQLAQSSYFVRLYDGSGKLLHEYGFRVTDAR
jgi:hypothetical protein